MKFSDIPGHDEAKQRLRAMADSGRLPHALLIEGPTGTGKMALARAFVQYVHCPNHTPDGEPCGVCPSCRQHQALQHIDTQIVLPVVKKDGAATPPVADDFIDQERTYLNANLFVDPATWTATFTKKNARPTHYVTQSSELIRSLSLTANASRYKAVIFWQPEVMQPAAANKLLKLIEEPAMIRDCVGFKGEIRWDASKPDGTMRKLCDVSKLHSLGWHHKVELDEGISRLYKWYTDSIPS